MTNFYIDFRFVEIEYELWAVKEYIRIIEQQLPHLAEVETARIYNELEQQNSTDDEAEVYLAQQNIEELSENVLPRFFRSPILITLWTIYESAIIEIANYLKKKGQHQLSHKDIKASSTLESIKKYYDHVLKFPLSTDDTTWKQLQALAKIRNVLAHGNGRKDAVSKQQWDEIKKYEKTNRGIRIERNFIVFSADFINEAHDAVNSTLTDLIKRVRER